jgi:hypothetical protein
MEQNLVRRALGLCPPRAARVVRSPGSRAQITTSVVHSGAFGKLKPVHPKSSPSFFWTPNPTKRRNKKEQELGIQSGEHRDGGTASVAGHV